MRTLEASDTVHVLTILSVDGDSPLPKLDVMVFAELHDLKRHLYDIIIKHGLPHVSGPTREALIPALEAKHYDDVLRIYTECQAKEAQFKFTFAVHATPLM